MAVRIRDTSRLGFATLGVIDGVEFWDLTEYPQIIPRNDDLRYEVSRGDRIDLLAYKFYGNPDLWWVIAIANDMEMPATGLNEGETIRIPTAQRVFNEILQAK